MASSILPPRGAGGPPQSERERKAGVIFGSIASQADTIKDLCIQAIECTCDEHSVGELTTFLVAARELCGHIGLLADLGANVVGEIEMRGGAEQWLLPPFYTAAAGGAA